MDDNEWNYWDLKTRRKIARRRVLRGASLGVGALALAGCASPPPTPAATVSTGATGATATTAAPATPAAAQPKRGGTISTLTTSNQPNLEPHTGLSGLGVGVGAGICYSTLLTLKWGPDITPPTYIPHGDLAESWTQPDDLTYLFKLRPGVKWHNIAPVNGRELVADDIIYSFERIREKRTFSANLEGIIKMEAVDRATLKSTLDRPNADLLGLLAHANLLIVARERAEQTGGNLNEQPLIGTGPFLLETFEPGQRTTVKRNPDYFLRGRPYIDTYTNLQVASDPTLMLTAFRGGAANVLSSGVSQETTDNVQRAMPSAVISYIPSDRVTLDIILNTNLEMFRDVRVRQAIHKAIDRKAIIDTIWAGHARLATGVPLPDPSYGLPEAEMSRLFTRDVEGARRLLREAGQENLSFEMPTANSLSGAIVAAAELIQANLKDIGVTITIRPNPTATLLTGMQSGNFQAVAYVVSTPAPNGWLYGRHYTGGPVNFAKYSNAEMDRLIDQQAPLARDPEGRKRIIQDIQRKIINDAAYVSLIQYDSPNILAPEVKGYYPPVISSSHNIFWVDVWLDK